MFVWGGSRPWWSRRSAPIAPPLGKRAVRNRCEELHEEADAVYTKTGPRFGLTRAEGRKIDKAKKSELYQESSLLWQAEATRLFNDQMSFLERRATLTAGINVIFINPDCVLRSPQPLSRSDEGSSSSGPSAGVNHSGRDCHTMSWDAPRVKALKRVIEHTNARLVLTAGIPAYYSYRLFNLTCHHTSLPSSRPTPVPPVSVCHNSMTDSTILPRMEKSSEHEGSFQPHTEGLGHRTYHRPDSTL